MKLNIRNMKNCIDCEYAIIYGTKDAPIVNCGSKNSKCKDNFRIDGRCAAASCEGYVKNANTRQGIIDEINAYNFILAGQSNFILHSTKTNDDFRFKLDRVESKDIKYFVNVYDGKNKQYAGLMWFDDKACEFKYGKGKGNVEQQDIRIRSLIFVLNKLYKNEKVQNLEVYHLGKCAVCGEDITDYREEQLGIHDKCKKEMYVVNRNK